jgi:hypothetical protein
MYDIYVLKRIIDILHNFAAQFSVHKIVIGAIFRLQAHLNGKLFSPF